MSRLAPTAGPIAGAGAWSAVLAGEGRARIEAGLPGFLARQRWFGAKARVVTGARIRDAVPLGREADAPALLVADVALADGSVGSYLLVLAVSPSPGAPGGEVARLDVSGKPAIVDAAEHDPRVARALVGAIGAGGILPGTRGAVVASATPAFATHAAVLGALAPSLLGAEQSNTSIRLGEEAVLKLFRRVEPGPNPDVEIGEFLTTVAGYRHGPAVLGSAVYAPDGGEPAAVAVLQRFVRNRGDAWALALGTVAGRRGSAPGVGVSPSTFLDEARLLGRRTAELHLALASRPDVGPFAPEPFDRAVQARMRARLVALAGSTLGLLERRAADLPGGARSLAEELHALRDEVPRRTAWLVDADVRADRIRIHGDLHLGQFLRTDDDFVVVDFEGEPARTLAERREKGSALRDVAGMVRSFHYASRADTDLPREGQVAPAPVEAREAWYAEASKAYVEAYLATAGRARFLPVDRRVVADLLAFHLLEKAVYEVAYELENRPAWVGLPLGALVEMLRAPPAGSR